MSTARRLLLCLRTELRVGVFVMTIIVWVHVAAGSVALVAGFAALSAAKGGRRHRLFGRAFLYTMVAMGLSGAGIAAATGVETSVVMGILSAYLVITAATAVVPPLSAHRGLAVAGALLAAGLAITFVDLGRRALATQDGAIEGLPAPMAFVFAGVTALAAVSDLRWLVRPQSRRDALVRHLWRMCFALFIAAASFFLGQMRVLPMWLRQPVLLAFPVVVPLVAMGLWRWRLRVRLVKDDRGPVKARVRQDQHRDDGHDQATKSDNSHHRSLRGE